MSIEIPKNKNTFCPLRDCSLSVLVKGLGNSIQIIGASLSFLRTGLTNKEVSEDNHDSICF